MAQVVISFAGENRINGYGGYGDKFPFTPCFRVRRGDTEILRVWIELDGMIGEITVHQLKEMGTADPVVSIKKAMLRYGVQRIEPVVREMLSAEDEVGEPNAIWKLGRDDRPLLLELATSKTCDYQAAVLRDLFCTIPSPRDPTAHAVLDGRKAAPTSRAICNACHLPDTDFICSHLLHPNITGRQSGGYYTRTSTQALCDLGRDEVDNPGQCHLGGHTCARRILPVETAPVTPQLSAFSVAESFDVLDAHWRLAFGKGRRLLRLSTLSGAGALTLGCTTRADFESRIKALADVIDRLSIDDDLLPEGLKDEQKTGSLNRLDTSMRHKLPADQHAAVGKPIRTLRHIRNVRTAVAHGLAQGGLTESLAVLGITDAPPNWAGAWHAIRAATVDALTVIRQELLRWIDSQS